MPKIAFKVLAVAALAGSMASVAGANTASAGSKPSSFAPQANTNGHVYGTPIDPPIVGHAKSSHHQHPQRHASTGAAAGGHAPRAPAHHGKAKASR